jgi:hypothetical protein
MSDISHSSSVIQQLREKFSSETPQFPQRIRRCFMTGKQCIYCTQHTSMEYPGSTTSKSCDVFVVMPFRPNLDTFYDWSLKRFLCTSLDIKSDMVGRADDFSNIGYVMCEKICKRIQDAEVAAIDLSVDNPNVFYELGIAVGLNKALLVFCDQECATNRTKEFWESFGFTAGMKGRGSTPNTVIMYQNVGPLDGKGINPLDMAFKVPLSPLKPELKIVKLLVPDRESLSNTSDVILKDDIAVMFESALQAAVGVAMTDIRLSMGTVAELSQEIEELLSSHENPKCKYFIIENGTPKRFKQIAEIIDGAFTCLIDLAGENPYSYFWLGYCHARGINVIPIFRILAFDIRALWYIHFNEEKVQKLANELKAVLEELILRDMPRIQRNIFWERLTRRPTVHIYTGATHHEGLNREMVGDWDQQTVSELVRYISSSGESVVPKLERPVYLPETIMKKLGEEWKGKESLAAYKCLIETEIRNKNCLIIATAESNPLTEVVLARAYRIPDQCFNDFDPKINKIDKIVVALKQQKVTEKRVPTFFCANIDGLKNRHRGLLVDNKILQLPYKAQDEADEDFSVLAHLAIMYNPFSDNDYKDTIIVILNGVSGPGTFGLGEILTGGTNPSKAISSEKILQAINACWENFDKNRKDFSGVEAIIEVKIITSDEFNDGKKGMESYSNEKLVHRTFYDRRAVSHWNLWDAGDIHGRNPRLFPG